MQTISLALSALYTRAGLSSLTSVHGYLTLLPVANYLPNLRIKELQIHNHFATVDRYQVG
jgi:hypothetical protein